MIFKLLDNLTVYDPNAQSRAATLLLVSQSQELRSPLSKRVVGTRMATPSILDACYSLIFPISHDSALIKYNHYHFWLPLCSRLDVNALNMLPHNSHKNAMQ